MRFVILFAMLLAAGGVFLMRAAGASESAFAYRDAEIVATGRALYDEFCASCHGSDLEGQENWQVRDADGYLPAPPHDAEGHTWHHPDAQLFDITKFGTEALAGGNYRSNMEAFEGILTDDEITAVLAFIKSTWPQRIIDRHNQMNAAYEEATKP